MPTLTERLRVLADTLPDDATVTLGVGTVRGWLSDEPSAAPPSLATPVEKAGWRERLWTCPPDTRLGVKEVAEAVGRSVDWTYRACSTAHAAEHGRGPLPYSKIDGVSVFAAGTVRDWLQASEIIVNPEPTRTARTHIRSYTMEPRQ